MMAARRSDQQGEENVRNIHQAEHQSELPMKSQLHLVIQGHHDKIERTFVPNAMRSGQSLLGLQAIVAPLSSICVIFVMVEP